jgi:Asp-tRNA(Asn)/Glu-tRNA(Gln) amidotransferase A subunit family amidase
MLYRLTLSALREELSSGRVTALEVVDDYLSHIEAVNPQLNAFVAVYAERARERARESLSGPLAGVPISIKDSFDIAGRPTYCGSRFRMEHGADVSATCVQRLEAAGAIIIGKTNTPEFLANYETDNHIIGRTNNPWNADYTPGGSSGGEAAAIAACFSAGGMGSDGGGSVRWPAQACGIAALKPTPGRVPATGHEPKINHPGGLLGVAGPMARTAADLKLIFEVVAGYDDQDPFSVPIDRQVANFGGLKIGWADRFGSVPVGAEIAAAVKDCARRVERDLNLAIEHWTPKGLEKSPNLWSFFFSELPAEFIRETISGRETDAHWTGTELLDQLAGRPLPTARQIVENLAARDAMRGHLLRQMHDFRVLLWPVAGTTAFKHRERRFPTDGKEIGLFQAMMPLFPANLLGLPAVVIPWSISADGLPIGIQLIGRPWEEELLLDLAIRLEEARGPFALPTD